MGRDKAIVTNALVVCLALLILTGFSLPAAKALTTKARSYYENKQTVGGIQIENHGSYFEVWNNGLVDNFPSSLVDSYANTENYERVAYSVHKSAKTGRSSFSPSVKNTFSWQPTPYIKRAGPKENYVEENGIEVIPYPRDWDTGVFGGHGHPNNLTSLNYVEVWDNRGTSTENDDMLLENIPRWQISPKGLQVTDGSLEVAENFVSFRPSGKSVYLFTLENIRINGKKPPFRTKHLLKNPNVSFDVKLSKFGRRLIRATKHPTNFLPYIENYYFVGLKNFSFSKLKDMFSRLKLLAGEFDYLPVYHQGKLLENTKCNLSLTNQGAELNFSVSLDEKHRGFACASGKLGSHSISWTVSSQTDWWNNDNPSENDVRTTISNGSLKLTGENLVGYWSMDENLGTDTEPDLTSLNNDGTINGASYTTGKWDNALDFSSDYVDGLGYEVASAPLSVSVWVKTSQTGFGHIFGRAGSADSDVWQVSIGDLWGDANGTYELGIMNDGTTASNLSTGVSTDGNWHMLTFTYDTNGDVYLYLDAQLKNSKTTLWNGSLQSSTIPRYMGEDVGNGNSYDGVIDEVMQFNRVLSENEIKRIYNRTKPDNLTGDDLKTGTWTSQVWDSGNTTNIIENVDYSATVGSGENVWWNIEATDTSENTGWFQDEDNLITQSELPNNIQGENFQVSIKLETDNTTHSPSVQDYTLNVSTAILVPNIESISVDNTLIDRDIDYSGSGADDNCTITATVRDNDGLSDLYRGDNAPQLSIRDSQGNEVAHRPVAWENLVGYWDFQDNSSLDVWDKSSENNAGTMYNMTTDNYVSGKRGRALEFDGENDYVEVPKSPSLSMDGPFTWSFWLESSVDVTSDTSMGVMEDSANESYVRDYQIGNGVLKFYWEDEAGNTYVPQTDVTSWKAGEWHYVVFGYDGGDTWVYIDGSEVDRRSVGDVDPADLADFVRMGSAFVGYLDGLMDEVRIYDRALSENEIREIYRSGLRYHETGENTVEISTAYNPSDSLADSQLGGFDAKASVVDNAGATGNLASSNLFTVSDRAIENIAFENKPGHVLKVTADSSRVASSPPENLVGYWNFEDNSTLDTWDWSQESNAGTMKNMTTDNYVDGKLGRALEFDGADDYVDISGFSVNNTPVTIMAWFYAESIGSVNRQLVFWGDGAPQWELRIDGNDGTTDFFWYDGTTSHGIEWSNLPTTGEWHQLVGVYDDGTGGYALYLDGSKEATATDAVNPSADGTSNRIGRHPGGYGEPFDGKIDEVRIYDRALSESEIKRLYRRTGPATARVSDNNLGGFIPKEYDGAIDVSYETTQDGNVTVRATDGIIDGISSSQTYPFPNLAPNIDSVSIDNALIDRDADWSGSNAVEGGTITVQISDEDNRTGDLEGGAQALLSIRDNTDSEVLTDRDIISTESAVDENTVRVTYPYNPSDAIGTGNFDTKIEALDNFGGENLNGYAGLGYELFTVDDIENVSPPAQENLAGHRHRISVNFRRATGRTLTLTEAWRIDNNEGEAKASTSGTIAENTYAPSSGGKVYFKAESSKLDGCSDNLNYSYPNIPPTIDSYSSSESLIDKDIDFTGSGAVEKTDLTITVTDNDNRNDLDSATLIVRDNSDTQVYGENLHSSSSIVDENTVKYTLTYDASDNTASFGSYDFYGEVHDNYGGSDSGWDIATFDVSDITTSLDINPTSPYLGWPVEISGTASREYGSGALDNAWLVDDFFGTFNLGAGNSWSKTYTLEEVGLGENIGVKVQMKDPPLDGVVSSSYETNENQKFQVELRWENSGNLVDSLSGHDFEIKFWYGKGNVKTTNRVPLGSARENIIVHSRGEEAFLARVYDNTPKDYWRARVPRMQGGVLPFLMVHKDENIFQYKFKLKDYTGEFDNGYVRFYTGRGIVNEDWWDASANTYAYLKYHGYYAAKLFSADRNAQMDIRHFQAEANLTPDPFIAATVEQAENMAYRYGTITDYAYRDNEGDIRAQWSSKDNDTKLVNVKVWDSRMKDNLLENVSYAHPTDVLFQYTEADNSSYWVEITTEHPKYGTFTDSFPIGPVILPVPYSPAPIPHLHLPIPLASLGGFIMVAIVGMMFYAGESGNAMLAIAVMVSFLALIGMYAKIQLMPISGTLIGFVWAVAIMWKLSEGS